jgi:hypothetical protein
VVALFDQCPAPEIGCVTLVIQAFGCLLCRAGSGVRVSALQSVLRLYDNRRVRSSWTLTSPDHRHTVVAQSRIDTSRQAAHPGNPPTSRAKFGRTTLARHFHGDGVVMN